MNRTAYSIRCSIHNKIESVLFTTKGSLPQVARQKLTCARAQYAIRLGLGVQEISIAAGTGADVMVGAASAPTTNVLAHGAPQHLTWVWRQSAIR